MIITINNELPLYGIFLLSSYLVSYILVTIYLYKKRVEKEFILVSILLHFICTLMGGVLFTTLAHTIETGEFKLTMGLSSMGGLLTTLLLILLYRFLFKENKNDFTYSFIMTLPLIYGVSKLSCFFSGCCYGMKYDGFMHIRYISNNEIVPKHNVFPIQLVESITFIVLALIFYFLIVKITRADNKVLFIEIIACCILKFSLDYLRNRESLTILSINQVACLVLAIIVFVVMIIDNYFKYNHLGQISKKGKRYGRKE